MRLRRGAALAAAGLGLLWMQPADAAPACPVLGYVNAVQAAAASLDATPPGIADTSASLQDALRAQPDAARVLQPVLDDLSLSPPALSDARSRLRQIAGVLALPPHATCTVDSGSALGALHDTYASPVFSGLDQSQQPSLLEQVGNAVGSAVSRILDTLGPGGSLGVGLLILAGVAALALLVLRRRGGIRMGGGGPRGEPREAGDDPDREWSLALAAARAGEYREAVRRAFRSALLDVALRGRLRIDSAWTTRDLLGAAGADAELLHPLRAAAAQFDRAWYSGRAVGPAEWQEARDRCGELRNMARRTPRAAA